MSKKPNIFANIPHQLSSAFLMVAFSAGMVFGGGHESPHTRREEELIEKGTELVQASPVARGTARTYNLGGLGSERAVQPIKNPFHGISRSSLRGLGTLFLAASLSSEKAVVSIHEESFELPHTTDQEEKLQRRREFEDMQEGKLGIRDFSGPGLTAAYHIPATAMHPAVTLWLPAKLSI